MVDQRLHDRVVLQFPADGGLHINRSQTAAGGRCLLRQRKDDWTVTNSRPPTCNSLQVERRGQGDQYLHRETQNYRDAVCRKMNAFHLHVQLGCVAQGLPQHLALNRTTKVWRQFRSWLRTMNTQRPPSELVVAYALRNSLFEFLGGSHDEHDLKKILLENMDPNQVPQLHMVA